MIPIENVEYRSIDDAITAAHEAEWYVFATGDTTPRYIAVHNGWHPRELRWAAPVGSAGDYWRWIKLDPVTERRERG